MKHTFYLLFLLIACLDSCIPNPQLQPAKTLSISGIAYYVTYTDTINNIPKPIPIPLAYQIIYLINNGGVAYTNYTTTDSLGRFYFDTTGSDDTSFMIYSMAQVPTMSGNTLVPLPYASKSITVHGNNLSAIDTIIDSLKTSVINGIHIIVLDSINNRVPDDTVEIFTSSVLELADTAYFTGTGSLARFYTNAQGEAFYYQLPPNDTIFTAAEFVSPTSPLDKARLKGIDSVPRIMPQTGIIIDTIIIK